MQGSTFVSTIEYNCRKKSALFDGNKAKYAVRSMYAGVILTLGTAAGVVAADTLNMVHPALGRFAFPFMFSWGLVYILSLNAELTTSNMMYLTAGTFLKKIKWQKALAILMYCTLFNLLGSILAAWLFDQTSAFAGLTAHNYLPSLVEHKLERGSRLVLFEGIMANLYVNVAVLAYLLLKEQMAKIVGVFAAVYMFVFLANEHVAANFASFSLVAFNPIAGEVGHFEMLNILRHCSIAFFANWVGGGLLIGLPYAFLNRDEERYVD
ncbi:formate/nitrite transporter family protein [Eikenella sp. S3360]|uniref:Formate/nitrite transporter family protein n=1 Tax=Eikenella glucosivorans TaxID=2766967 RepID=A0ABS0NBW6_9NEIS|nr:formate/nitrite transporter family protein [Eikenella glucosivorans]MBH5329755.1 formate/nitrite transporter family protein [Eikenella glucosivorans]